jgi:hypothetical protein
MADLSCGTIPTIGAQSNWSRRAKSGIGVARAQWAFTGAGDLILADDEPVRTIESGLIPIAKSKSPWLKPLLLWVNFQGPEGPCSLP